MARRRRRFDVVQIWDAKMSSPWINLTCLEKETQLKEAVVTRYLTQGHSETFLARDHVIHVGDLLQNRVDFGMRAGLLRRNLDVLSALKSLSSQAVVNMACP